MLIRKNTFSIIIQVNVGWRAGRGGEGHSNEQISIYRHTKLTIQLECFSQVLWDVRCRSITIPLLIKLCVMLITPTQFSMVDSVSLVSWNSCFRKSMKFYIPKNVQTLQTLQHNTMLYWYSSDWDFIKLQTFKLLSNVVVSFFLFQWPWHTYSTYILSNDLGLLDFILIYIFTKGQLIINS